MRARKFHDDSRGDGWFVAGRHWLVAVRWRWHFYFIRPRGKPGYTRIYLGPFELELRP